MPFLLPKSNCETRRNDRIARGAGERAGLGQGNFPKSPACDLRKEKKSVRNTVSSPGGKGGVGYLTSPLRKGRPLDRKEDLHDLYQVASTANNQVVLLWGGGGKDHETRTSRHWVEESGG